MAKKLKADAGIEEEDAPRAHKRNRASPIGLVKLYEFISEDQARAIQDMELDSLLDIKCHCLNNKLINWFASLYDKNTREFVIPGRGRIPLDEESVYRTLGLPYGTNPVVYSVDREVEASLGALLFPADGSTPMTSRVYQILKDMTDSGDAFKQTFVMYVISTVLSPTTRNRVSNRCYPVMANIGNVHTLQWCKFVADQLHDELSKGSASQTCLFHLQLLYVDSLDVSGLDLDLPQACFASNIWSKEDIDKVLLADLRDDKVSYGKLELKSQFAIPYTLFGGAAGFTKCDDSYDPDHFVCLLREKNKSLDGDAPVVPPSAASAKTVSPDMDLGVEHVVHDAPSSSMASEPVVDAATMAIKTVVAPTSGGTVAPDMGLGGELVVDDAPSASMVSETIVDAATMATDTLVSLASGGTVAPDIGLGDALPATMASETVVDAATMATETLVALASGGTLARAIGLGDAPSATMATETLVALASGGTLARDIGPGSETEMMDSIVNADVNAVDVNKGRDVATTVDLGKKAPVTSVYKSTRPKKRLCSLEDKDREIKSLVCNELGITSDMAPFGLLDNESNPKKATPKRKNIPKSRAHLSKNQDIRSSPHLAKLHSLASVSIKPATTSPIELDMSSPEVSPARIEVAAAIEAGPLDVHATSAGGGALSSPPSDTGAFTQPELATQADATTVAEAANETLAAAESNAAEAALSDHTVAEPAPAHCVQPDIPSVPCVQPRVDKDGNIFISATTLFNNVVPVVSSDVLLQEDPIEKADVVEGDGPTDDTPYQGSRGVFVPATSLFPVIEPPMWNITSQSPVSEPAVAPSPDVPSDVDGVNNPSQPLSNATATPVLSVSSDALDDIPEGIPLGAPVGITSSSNEDAPVGCANPSSIVHAPGDLFHEFEPEGLVPLSLITAPGNFLILHVV
ncbi:hypothetical protein ACQ4PT_037370 [Festuca glaucescens]